MNGGDDESAETRSPEAAESDSKTTQSLSGMERGALYPSTSQVNREFDEATGIGQVIPV
jgi:hypothetical protein